MISERGWPNIYIRLGLTRSKALQTVSQFPRETRQWLRCTKIKRVYPGVYYKKEQNHKVRSRNMIEKQVFFLDIIGCGEAFSKHRFQVSGFRLALAFSLLTPET